MRDRLSRPYSQLRIYSLPLISAHQALAGIHAPPITPLLELEQYINARFRNEQMLTVHLQHDKPLLIQGN
jgi:hypothetical protein